MKVDHLRRALFFVVVCLVQVLVLNHIHLFDCATPLFYVYFIITLPYDCPRWASLLWGFSLGLVIDVFTNTPGVAAASLTAVSLLQPLILGLFVQKENSEGFVPSLRTLRWSQFFTYSLTLVLIFCILFFSLETFHFFDFVWWAACVGGSTLLTVLLIMVVETVKKSKKLN